MTRDDLTITLSGPPMGKERVRVRRATGHVYTPERTINYEARLAHAAQQAMGERPLFQGPLAVVVEAYMAVAESKPKKWKAAALADQIRPVKKPDADNIAKLLDALNMVAWADDAQIVDLRVVKWYSARPRLAVSIREIKPEEGVFA